MATVHGTLELTDEEIIAIIYLRLQVYCSPTLKEHLHNPVMPLLARKIERKESTLHARGGVCVHVYGGCVFHVGVLLCVHIHLCDH